MPPADRSAELERRIEQLEATVQDRGGLRDRVLVLEQYRATDRADLDSLRRTPAAAPVRSAAGYPDGMFPIWVPYRAIGRILGWLFSGLGLGSIVTGGWWALTDQDTPPAPTPIPIPVPTTTPPPDDVGSL